MADLNARIKPKKSSATGEVPQATDLEVAEIAVNTADGKLFVKHTDNSIKEIGGGTDITTESIDALSDVDTTTAAPTDGQVLTWVNANNQWEPASAAGDVTSVNGQAGVVTLDVADLDDTYQVGDPLGSSVTLLLRGEGVNNGTTFTDESSGGLTPNGIGNCVTSTTEFKYGTSSIYQPLGHQITYADNSAWHVGSGDFTIETWFLVPSGSDGGFAIGHRGGETADNGWALLHDRSNNNFSFYWSLNGTSQSFFQSSTFVPTVDTWYHVAFVRNGTTGTIYIDGVSVGTGTVSGTINAPAFNFTVGAFRQNSGYFYNDEVYLDEVRLTKAARYISDFTPAAIELPGVLPSDGQVLTWVDANSQWEPVTPTDTDTNRIQDMGDFELNSSATVYVYNDFKSGGSGAPVDQGDWSAFVFSGEYQQVYWQSIDSNGNDITTDPNWPSTFGGQGDQVAVYWSSDGITWGLLKTPTSVIFDEAGDVWGQNTDATSRPLLGTMTGPLYLSLSDPSATAPLASGDMLRFDGTDFKPTSDYISKTVLKAEVAASTDFADFQSRIAAL